MLTWSYLQDKLSEKITGENTVHIMHFLKKEALYTHTHTISGRIFFNIWRKGLGNWRSGGLEDFLFIVFLFALLDFLFVCFFYHEHIFTDEETETKTG